ncbi:O-antigen ligase family protein [Algibacillus agarilyticus]|uniref:O-antigen ligase family protein n=1 Tax=Algibacillus agarilyticus TaxID=2234133 RepID=UPI00130019AE|nr:O-antigen ligase family protein [Algibacillus agarilyticus]
MFIINLAVVIDNKQRQKIVIKVIIASGLTQAIYAIFLQYSGWEYSPLGFKIIDRANGSFVYHNHLAGYLVLCLSVAIGYMIGSLKGMRAKTNKARLASVIETMLSEKWILRIAIIIMVIALIMTRSRMGNSAFFVSLLVTSGLALLLMKRPPNTLKWLVASLIILDIAIVGAYFGVDKVKERLEATSFQSETRDDVVAASIPYIQDYWLTGSGAGTFGSTFQSYQLYSFGGYYDHAHNEYLQFLVEFGIAPSVLMFVMLVLFLLSSLMNVKKDKRFIYFTGCMAIIALMMHITVDFMLQAMPISLLLITILFFINNTQRSFNR